MYCKTSIVLPMYNDFLNLDLGCKISLFIGEVRFTFLDMIPVGDNM